MARPPCRVPSSLYPAITHLSEFATDPTGLPYASVHPGVFHGCGHDAHTAILLGTARYLVETRDFAGTVIFIFQPAEEGLGGARAMIEDGLFRDFPIDEIYGLHNATGNRVPPNHFRVSPGVSMAGADFFDITLRGQGAHAAHPDAARDPVPASAELIQSLQTIVSRSLKPTEAAVLSITKIAAGSAYNVIPETVTIGGTIRARVRTIATHVAAAHELTAEVDIRDIFSVLSNDPASVDNVAAVARQVLGDDKVTVQHGLVMGSEDFADRLKHAPGAFFVLGHAGQVPAHNPRYILDDAILPVGATLFARLVEDRLAAG